MSPEANKQRVADFFRKGPAEGNFDLLADDVTFWVAGSTPHSGTKTKQQIRELHAQLSEHKAGPFTIVPTHMIAEGNFVAVEAEGHLELKNGRVYNNRYHILFEFRDGKIKTVREYSDTDHLRQIFSP